MSIWSRFLGLPQKGELSHCVFRVGQNVVCISNGAWVGQDGKKYDGPQKGDVRTIAAFWPNGSLKLVGENPRLGFFRQYFRPVRETSIDCFTALLAKPPVRLREDA